MGRASTGTGLRMVVAGATGALGGEIIKVLDQVSWRPEHLAALARASTSTTHVEYGEERVPVDDLSEDTIEGADAVFLALPAGPARAIGETASRRGLLTIDCSGAFAEEPSVPLVVPWINPEALSMAAQDASMSIVALPDPTATLIASLLGPLRRAGIDGLVQATALVPASREGKAGIEELSRQVVTLFNQGNPPRKVFPHGLAFDLIPAVTSPAETGWTAQEEQISAQIARLAPSPMPHDVTVVQVPVFSGLSVQLSLQLQRPPMIELVLRILAEGGVRVPEAAGVRYLPRPRRVEGHPFAHVGRVRMGRDGRTLHLWASMDNLRTTATAAVAAAAALLQVGQGSEAGSS
jgi:aspartate-semialdehyde dehydrogenase